MDLSKIFKAIAVFAMVGLTSNSVRATEEFLVPFPAEQTLQFLQGISSDASCNAAFGSPDPVNPVNLVTDLVVRVAGTIIVIDHWENEDGVSTAPLYEAGSLEDIANGVAAPVQASTRIYGDGDVSNGAAPGVVNDVDDVLFSGQVIVFTEEIDVTNSDDRRLNIENAGADIFVGGVDTNVDRVEDGIDGQDRIFATETINVTRSQWAGTFVGGSSSGTLFAGAFELFPQSQWGETFTVPVGENSGADEFEWTGLTVMVANDGTLVNVDVNGDGDFTDVGIDRINVLLNAGETLAVAGNNDTGGQTNVGLQQGARVITSDIAQVNLISGNECSNYESRWFTIFPDALLGNEYYEPVSTPVGDETAIYLYNPSFQSITVNWEVSVAADNAGVLTPPIVIPPQSTVSQTLPSNSGARFFTDDAQDSFGALTVTDAAGSTHDWGHASTSRRLMGNVIQVGFAEGDDPSVDTLVSNDLSFTVFTGNFADVDDIDGGTVSSTGTSANIDLQGEGGDNFGLIYEGFINLVEDGVYTFETTSDDGSTITINNQLVVDNDFNQAPTSLQGTYNSTVFGGGWVPIEIRYREVGGGQVLSASYQPPSAGALEPIPATILSNDGIASPAGENGSPVWLVADNPFDFADLDYEICVDVSGDGGPNTDPFTGFTYDYTFTADRLTSYRLFDGGVDTPNNVPANDDGDQSGMLAFVCDGSDTILAAAWGQDPLTASAALPAIDFGTTVRSVSADVAFLGDTIFEDINGDGIRQAGEPGIQGVTVILTPPSGINLGNGPGQALALTTDFNGSYLFSGLVSGNYTIEVIPPSGFVQTLDPDEVGVCVACDSIASPEIIDAIGRLDQDFGYQNTVTTGDVGDTIFEDTNGNGIQDFTDVNGNGVKDLAEPGEPGIAGIDVQLCEVAAPTLIASEDFNASAFNNNAAQWVGPWVEQNDDNSAATATFNATFGEAIDGFAFDSGAFGNFFPDVALVRGNAINDGPRITREFDPSAFVGTDINIAVSIGKFNPSNFYEADDELLVQISTDGTNFTTIDTIEGQVVTNSLTPINYPFSVATVGTVFIRFQVNGNVINGGGAFEGLLLDDLVITGVTDVCLPIQTTDANGNYLYSGVAPANYRTTVLNPPAGFVNTGDPGGNGDNENLFTLSGSGGNLEQDYGYFQPANVIGHVYFDENGNGVQDITEPNLPNLNVEITDSLGNLQVVTTDASGNYSADVPPGATIVQLDETDPDFPTGFLQTEGIDPSNVTALAGTTVNAGNDGFFQGNTLGDTIYQDDDGNGSQDPGELGLANVIVTLTPPAGVDLGAGNGVAITTSTDSNGNYLFVGLPDGNYSVTVNQPGGSTQTQDPDQVGTCTVCDNTASAALSGGIDVDTFDFGYQFSGANGRIGDLIYNDANGNGVFDAGDSPLSGIQVELCGDLDNNNASPNTCRVETTGVDGFYTFGDGLEPDQTTPNVADTAVPNTDGAEVYTVTVLNPPAGQINSADPDGGLPNFSQLTINNVSNLDQDFGYFNPGLVTGHLYFDTNGDGTQQVGEPDLVNVDVIITDSAGNTQTVTTDGNGDYSASVPAGSTTVDVDETDPQFPANVTQTEGDDPTVVTAVGGSTVSAGIDGYTQLGSIGDLIFFDNAGGTIGQFDVGVDTGIANVTVILTPPAGVDLGNGAGADVSTPTDFNGNYTFDLLPAGTYTVTVVQPGGTDQTVDPDFVGDCSGTANCNNVTTITIATGEQNNDADFGYQLNGTANTIGDTVFNDFNGNGIQDVGETGIAGLTIEICGDLDDDNGTPETCRTEDTDVNGNYLFGNGIGGVLPDNPLPNTDGTETYVITVTNPPVGASNSADPDGGTPSISQITLPSSLPNLDQDFGYVFSSISGSVSQDTVGDGVGDAGLAGVTILLYSDPNGDGDPSDGSLLETAVTDSNGDYSFTGVGGSPSVPAGDYVLVEVDPSGFSSLSDGDSSPDVGGDQANAALPVGNVDNYIPVSIPDSGEVDADNNFVDTQIGSIGGTVWFDEDLDGVLDIEEAGITDVSVQLFTDPNGDGDSSDGVLIATTVTDQNGNYLFADLPPGDFVIDVVDASIPAGLINTAGVGGVDPKAVELAAGEEVSDVDFGYVPDNNATEGAIGDRVWADANGDGLQDPGEAGISGVILSLRDSAGALLDTAVTNENGDYLFTGIDFTTANDLTVTIDTGDANLVGYTATSGPQSEGGFVSRPLTISAPFPTLTDVDFGFDIAGLNSITDTFWFDSNADGIFDPTEQPIAGVTVNLYNDSDNNGIPDDIDGDGQPEVVASTTSDANGDVDFTGLIDGNYIIGVIDSSGELVGLNGTTDEAVAEFSDTVVLAGGINDDQDSFGYNNPGLISGVVYADGNNNSDQDSGEVGIGNQTVTLLQDADNNGSYETVLSIATTATDGSYAFDGLLPGEYRVDVTPPAGTQTEDPDATANDQTDISLPVGQSSTDNNFGYTNVTDLFDITGTVFLDTDRDGIEDVTEVGIPGVTLELSRVTEVITLASIIDGQVDIDNNGIIDANDDGSYLGADIVDGGFDLNSDGSIDEVNDSGTAGALTVVDGIVSIAHAGTATLSSTLNNNTATFGAANALNLVTAATTNSATGGMAHTGNVTDTDFFELDLLSVQPIGSITIFNRDGNTSNRLDNVLLLVSDTPFPSDPNDFAGALANADFVEVLDTQGGVNQDPTTDLSGLSGRFVRLQKTGGNIVNGVALPNVNGRAINIGEIRVTPAFIPGDIQEDGVIATTTVDANGDYAFEGLPNGDYTVAVTDTNAVLGGFDLTSGLDVLGATINNANVTDVDFGYIREEATGSIAGEVWIDEEDTAGNTNGLADDPEPNLSGVDVFLCTSPVATPPCNTLSPEFVAQTTTDVEGEYSFLSLPAGNYEVDSDPTDILAGLDLTVDPVPVSLSEGESVEDVDVGYEPTPGTGLLSGVVWTDLDSDGVFDANETPISGVAIAANDVGFSRSTTTAADGSWIITNITDIVADNLANVFVTYDPADIPSELESVQPTNLPSFPDPTDRYRVDLVADEDNIINNLDFGFPPLVTAVLGSISGTIYSDIVVPNTPPFTYDQAQDNELAGITLNLVSGGAVIATTTTDDFGNYSFGGLLTGSYEVVITDLAGVTTDQNPLQTIANPIAIDTAGAVTDYIITDQDAGFASDPRLGSVGNKFFFDENDNGQFDEGEPGIEGITIQCWVDVDESETPNDPTGVTNAPVRGIDNLVRTVVTDENGEYYCTSLPTGQYIVTVVDSIGLDEVDDGTDVQITNPNVADDNFAKPWTYAITTASPNFNVDFGVRGRNTLSGTVFIEDESLVEPDGNGVVVNTELDGLPGGVSPDVGAEGVVVVLSRLRNNGTFRQFRTTTTDANGDYSFVGLPRGDYRVEVITSGSVVDGFGQTGDPDLTSNLNGNGDEDFVCDSTTAALCDNIYDVPTFAQFTTTDVTNVDFGYQRNFSTTPVTMNFFTSSRTGDTVTFEWETGNEIAHAGFQIYAKVDDEWQLLTEDVIGGLPGRALQVRRYTYQTVSDAQWFSLVDISTNEEVTPHGPFRLGQSYGSSDLEQASDTFDWSKVKLFEPANDDEYSLDELLRDALDNEERAQRALSN